MKSFLMSIQINFKKLTFFASAIFIAIFYSIFYSHFDLNHTSISSFALLNGHFSDFYEFNKIKMGVNDYLPLLYWVFALWNLPFCSLVIDCNTSVTLTSNELIVQKVLLALLFGISIKLVHSIVKEVTTQDGAISNATLFYSSSAVMLFCIFAFNQYDIVGMVLSLYGILFFLRNKLIRFSLLFSAAISVKYFAAIAFFPILLIGEKRVSRIVPYSLLASVIVLFQVYLYKDSPVFMASFMAHALRKVAIQDGISSLVYGLIACLSYLFILIGSWLYKPRDKCELLRACVFASILSYLVLYLKIDWHPQWICIITPYLALSVIFSKNIKLTLLFQLIFGASYLLLVVSRYPNNLDNFLLGAGFFGEYFGYSHIPIVNLYKFINFKWISWCFYLSIVYFMYICIASKKIKNTSPDYFLQTLVLWASNLIFIIPSLIIAFCSPQYLSKFDDTAMLRNRTVTKVANGDGKGSYFGGIKKGDKVVQFFHPELPNLTAISLMFGTYNKASNSVINFEIYTNKETIHSANLDFTKIYPNMLTTIRDISVGEKCKNGCYISMDVVSGELPLELWHEKNKNFPDSQYFLLNNSKVMGTFILEEFYQR